MAQLESLASRYAPTPEMVFAQKATAIVKAAGMNPRSIDLESFRKIAPLIFCKAYCAIYKENLITTVSENSSKGDLILNSQLVIDGLLTKTRNPALLEINGTDVLQGNHRAIGIIVGVLFGEGQRLWLEKSKQMETELFVKSSPDKTMNNADSPSKPKLETPNNNNNNNDNNDNKEESKPVVHDDDDALMGTANFSEELTDDEGEGGNKRNGRAKHKKLIKSKTGNKVTERELDGLLNRITYLEEQLVKTKGKNSSTRPQSAGNIRRSRKKINSGRRSGAGSSRSRSPHGERGGAATALLFSDESSDEGHKVESGDDNKKSSTPRKKQSRIAKLIEKNQKEMSNAVVDQAQLDRKYRPSSAPATRKVRHVSARLYSVKNNKEIQEIINPTQTTATNNPITPPKPKKASMPWDETAGPAPQYTYDLRSGRKVLLSQVELEALERKRSRYAMNNVGAGTDDDLMMGGGGGNKSGKQEPVKPEWPGKSTCRSVEAWVKKFKILREEHLYHPPEMPLAKSFGIYANMEKLDVVITVEHCFNCQHHNVSFRHDPKGYMSTADSFLRILSQIVYDNNLCVRVGVTRFPADITPKSVSSDVDSRIGAFEIQIAARKPNGDVISEMMHSKLAFKGWPSKTVIKKRVTAYLNKLNLPSYAHKLAAAKNAANDSDEDEPKGVSLTALFGDVEYCGTCAEPYPVGGCQWIETPLANPSWCYSSLNPNDLVDGVPAIQWVFDTRNLANTTKFKIGALVRIADVRYMNQFTERQMLLGTVRENLNTKTITVRLKYCNEDCVVAPTSCMLASEYQGRSVTYTEDKVPPELETILLIGKAEKLISWSVVDANEDKKEGNKQFYLGRNSFFNQVRKLSWAVESTLAARGVKQFTHPITGQRVDIQLSYSEEVLDWVFNRYMDQANMLDLEKTVKANAAAAPALNKGDVLYSVSSPVLTDSHQPPLHPTKSDPQAVRAASPAPTPAPQEKASVPPTPAPSMASMSVAAKPVITSTPASRAESPAVTVTVPPPAASAPVTKESKPTPAAVPAPTVTSPPPTAAPASRTPSKAPSPVNVPVKVDEPPKPVAVVETSVSIPVDMTKLRELMIHHISTAEDKSHGSAMSKMDIVELLSDSLHQLTEEHGFEAVQNYKSAHLLLDPNYSVSLELKVFIGCLEQYGLRVVTKIQSNVDSLVHHFSQQSEDGKHNTEMKIDMFIEWLLSGSLNKTRKSTKDLTIVATSPSRSNQPSSQVTPAPAPLDSVRSELSMDSALHPPSTPFTVTSIPEVSPRVLASTAATSVAMTPSITAEPSVAASVPSAAPVTQSVAPSVAATPSVGEHKDDAEVVVINSARSGALVTPLKSEEFVEPKVIRNVESRNAPDTGRDSHGSSKQVPPVDTRTDAERAEAEAMQELKERAKLDYQSKDLVFGSIIIEGEALEHAHYDTVMANLTIQDKHYVASVCLARERGSKRRSFNLSWGDILVKDDAFRELYAYLSIVVSDLDLAERQSKLPVLHNTQLDSYPKGDVSIVIHGHAHEAKEARTSRLMSMKPQDLMKMKFEPLPLELDDDLLEDSDENNEYGDEFMQTTPKGKNGKNLKSKSPQELHEEKQMASSLFPKASLHNLLSPAASTPALETSGGNEEEEDVYNNDIFDE